VFDDGGRGVFVLVYMYITCFILIYISVK